MIDNTDRRSIAARFKADDAPLHLGQVLLFGPVVAFFVLLIVFPGRNRLANRIAYEPPGLSVCIVEADPLVAGRAYAQLGSGHNNCYQMNQAIPSGTTPYAVAAVYQTNDYGQHWQPLDPPPPDWQHWHQKKTVPGVSTDYEKLLYGDQAVWGFPRAIFRSFFSGPASFNSFYSGMDIAPPTTTQPGVFYFAMGSYGLLVGPSPADFKTSSRPWQLIRTDFSGLNPPPLTLNDPLVILIVVLLALLVPPLPWINAWLIGQAWRYMFPITETRAAMRLAAVVSIVTTLFAAVAITVWLIDIDVDFYQIVGAMAGFNLLLTVVVGVRTARQRHYTDRFTRRLALATALLSLIVPAGVAATMLYFGWLIILALLLGFMLFRRSLNRYLDRFQVRATLWQTDRLTLEVGIVLLLLLVPIGLVAGLLVQNSLLFLLAVISIPFLSALALATYTTVRGRRFTLKKKASPLELHETPLFADGAWLQMLFWRSVGWIGAATIVGAMIFGLQVASYLWFHSLFGPFSLFSGMP